MRTFLQDMIRQIRQMDTEQLALVRVALATLKHSDKETFMILVDLAGMAPETGEASEDDVAPNFAEYVTRHMDFEESWWWFILFSACFQRCDHKRWAKLAEAYRSRKSYAMHG